MSVVEVTVPGGTFGIDATEVTVGQYAVFLAARPVPQDGAGPCGFNESLRPNESSYRVDSNCAAFDFDRLVETAPRQPVACIDWCDAAAYCAWAGKRLCGRVGGGALSINLTGDASSEWYNACSLGGTRRFPYGNAFDPVACNTHDSGHNQLPIEVMTLPSCEGGVPGLFDMSGNLDEWIDACDNFAPDQPQIEGCARMGGAFFQVTGDLVSCDAELRGDRSELGRDIGFRCCSER